ncbi:unnamed protein product [Rotaria magnacalcarata]|uniref:Uncharacterized protein n=5 Tax=Rotaria magnacalcarata TaxID=392030 RepID=A0A815HLY6_9BILA|nr:unnamed protein product [Rotaria magnacalcarata]CAF1354370.1 unnamed protein product [Rotaria magnacalcarata]CAF3852837.1 unnamed protein product [Rotaria magnacalcarata]
MGIKFYSKDIHKSKELPSLSSNSDQPFYVNTSASYYKTYHCSSGLSPLKTSIIKPNIDIHGYASIQNRGGNNRLSAQSCYLSQNNIYANISKPFTKSKHPMKSLSNTSIGINPQILYDNINNQFYENMKSSPKLSSSTIPLKLNEIDCYENLSVDNNSSHFYMNLLQQHEEQSSNIPISSEKNPCSAICPVGNKQVDIDKNSNTKAIQIIEKIEVNLAPSCRDKSVLYRTKMPNFTTSIPSSFRQRRRSLRSKRHSQRTTKSSQTIQTAHITHPKQQQQHSKSNHPTPPPPPRRIITDHRSKRSSYKTRPKQSPSTQLYHEIIDKSAVSDNQSEHNSIYSQGEKREKSTAFQRILKKQVSAWCPGEHFDEEELTVKCSFATENENSEQEEQITDDDDDEEEEEEFCRHETFEDFFLRRPPKSSCSTIHHNSTSPATSETIAHETPIKPLPLDQRAPSIALGLDKNDVEFIHDILERSYGDLRKSNRIIALREAYIRAVNKRNDLLKAKSIRRTDETKTRKPTPMKYSVTASKVRDELEKYDELPIHRMPTFDDNDFYSVSYRQTTNYCTIPVVLATANRIINFVTSLKRQVQNNFRDIRSKMNVENTIPPSRQKRSMHNSSGLSHQNRSRPKPASIHNSTETSHSHHQRQSHRSQPNRSQLQTPNLPTLAEQRLSYRPRTFRVLAHRQRLPRID